MLLSAPTVRANKLLLKAVPPSDECSGCCFGNITKCIKHSINPIASDLLQGSGGSFLFFCYFVNFKRVISMSVKIVDQTLLSFTLYNINDLYVLTLVTTNRT